MINCQDFYNVLIVKNIIFFTGVPDSLLKDICAYIADKVDTSHHIIAANEGGAIALATGYHLATGKIPMVYMQNSGFGNAINPLTSLTDVEVCGIPMLIMIGWRGEPGKQDEPQHKKQGRITPTLLEALELPYTILSAADNVEEKLTHAIATARKNSMPYIFLVKKDTFMPYALQHKQKDLGKLRREETLALVVEQLDQRDIVVSTTGVTSRELYAYREKQKQSHSSDFLVVGSMGHCSQIALGIALAKEQQQVYCIDGDGALLMHMGSLAIIGSQQPKNFKHIVINNSAHESVGGQPTAAKSLNIPAVAKACGYQITLTAKTKIEVVEGVKKLKESEGPALLEIQVKQGHRPDLGRPTTSPRQNKVAFMDFLRH